MNDQVEGENSPMAWIAHGMDSQAMCSEREKWKLVQRVLSLSRWLSALCIFSSIIVLTGYFAHIEATYRPIAGGPATHPLTAVSIFFLGLGIMTGSGIPHRVWISRICALLIIGITVCRFGEIIFGVDLLSWMTPFQDSVLLDQQHGLSNAIGVNTLIMLFSISVALGSHGLTASRLAQLTAFIAVAIPTVSILGYGYGLSGFYGQMSLITATAGFGVAGAALALTADHAILRALLSPYVGGRIARLQALTGTLITVALGYVMVRFDISISPGDESLFGIFVVIICWLILLMSGVSAAFHEKIDSARRQSEAMLATAARTDALTGLPNRRMFFEVAECEVERIRSTGGDLWLLMVDLDHFKKINDTGGHAVGDQVLRTVANLLSQSIREVDLVARIGGEEFAVLLTRSDQNECEGVAERIRQNIESLQLPLWTDVHGCVTASIGCAKMVPSGTLDDAMRAADAALYRAKNDGRNRVV